MVCEPMIRVGMEIPAEAVSSVLAAVARLGGVPETPSPHGDLTTLEILLPAARAQDLQRQLPGLTGGEGVAETSFGGYQPVTGPRPARRRTTADPLNRHRAATPPGPALLAAPGCCDPAAPGYFRGRGRGPLGCVRASRARDASPDATRRLLRSC